MNDCKICNQTLNNNGVRYCDECAEEQFSLDLGLKYLEYKQLEEDFFLKEVWEMAGIYFIDKKMLIELLKEEFRQQVQDESTFSNRKIRLEQLQNYCFEEIRNWIDFFNEWEVVA